VSSKETWSPVCPNSEFIVPGALKGVNPHLRDFSPLGGVLSHFLGNGLFGYGHGLLYSGLLMYDAHCGFTPEVFPRFECSVIEDLTGTLCMGLTLDRGAQSAEACRANCCGEPYCEVWQMMRNGACWRGRSQVCSTERKYAKDVVVGQRVH